MKFTIFQNSRQGPRQYNQDRIAYCYSKDAILAVVADGMGGHLYGEVAARFAVKMLTEAFQHLAMPILANPLKFLSDHIIQVHDAIGRHALAQDWPDCPRTTLVAAVMQHDELYCAHVGDSRLYHIRDGKIIFRTEDHSKVRMLYRKGLISKAELHTHPERNKVYNCVGGETPPQVDLAARRALWSGDVVMLCTDGLWSLLSSNEIGAALSSGAVTDSVPTLLDLAESRADQNGDNMSVIAVNWGEQPGTPQISTATMPMDLTTTIMGPLEDDSCGTNAKVGDVPDLSDEEIENSIAEIQAAIKKIPKQS
ncbi:MAG TPA: protein phosphatase 2C domain-containing protein [Novimethylophilus sp.]|jgi:serine/threonine protein phosphatase PrpC|uniref:PP2C family protein-serine/threonine phosphatase n=1 Tax=Novimethylophilus sp. TaxID=2137426 RepID=UPI002F409AC5